MLPDETGLQNDSAAGEGNAVGRLLRSLSDTTVFGSNPGNNPISNIRSSSQQTLKLQPVEYDADKPTLQVVGFKYSPNPEARSSPVVAASPSPSESDQKIAPRQSQQDNGKRLPRIELYTYFFVSERLRLSPSRDIRLSSSRPYT